MIKLVTEKDYEKYSAFLTANENGHFMQSLEWARFKKAQESFAIMSVDDNGDVRGAMLMFLQGVRRMKQKFLYCPRGPVCDRGSIDVLKELLSGAQKIAMDIGAYKLTFDPDIGEGCTPWLSYLHEIGARVGDNARDNAILQPFAVYRINVDKTDDELMVSYHSKARYSVRSSIKSGATCRIGTRDDIKTFRAMLAETAKRDGFTARGDDYFLDMHDLLGEDMFKLFMVEYEGVPIAGSVLLRHGKKTWHMYAGSNDEYKEALPNFLMQWEMQRWSRDNGCALYDMRGIAGEGDKLAPIEGLVRFKKRFGGELVSFVGRIDIIYDKKADWLVNAVKSTASVLRKIMGRG